jgi:hypothetical protein
MAGKDCNCRDSSCARPLGRLSVSGHPVAAGVHLETAAFEGASRPSHTRRALIGRLLCLMQAMDCARLVPSRGGWPIACCRATNSHTEYIDGGLRARHVGL